MKIKFANILRYGPALSLITILAIGCAGGSSASSAKPLSQRTFVPAVQSKVLAVVVPNVAVADVNSREGPDITQGDTSTPLTAFTAQAGDTLKFGSLKLVNNQWGAPPDEDLTSTVFLDQGRTFGWYWSRRDPKTKPGNTSAQPIYPSVRVGGNHVEQSNLSCFPIKLGEIKSLDILASYDYSSTPTGAFNLAYDMFLLDTNKSGPHAVRKAEIMIWMHGTIGQPSQDYKGDFTDGHNTYKLYSYTMPDGRLYAAFVMEGQPQFQARHTVDIKRLVDNLNLDDNWYIPGIELGNEIVSGSGKIEISQFSVNLNGSAIE